MKQVWGYDPELVSSPIPGFTMSDGRFPFQDGERFQIEGNGKRFTVVCRYQFTTARSRGGDERVPVSCSLTTIEQGWHVNYDEETREFSVIEQGWGSTQDGIKAKRV